MNYQTEEKIKKMLIWRIISILFLMVFFWIYTSSIFEAAFLALVVFVFHSLVYFVFDKLWEKYVI